MKLNAMRILRETMIVLPLLALSPLTSVRKYGTILVLSPKRMTV